MTSHYATWKNGNRGWVNKFFSFLRVFLLQIVRKSLFASGIFFIFRQFTQNKIQEFPLKNKTIN